MTSSQAIVLCLDISITKKNSISKHTEIGCSYYAKTSLNYVNFALPRASKGRFESSAGRFIH